MTDFEKYAAAFEVLDSKALIKKMIAQCCEGEKANRIAGFIENLQNAFEEEQKAEKKAQQLATIQSLIDSGVLDAADLKSLNLKVPAQDKAPRKPQEKKWIRFEHDGKEYFINRSTSGKASGALDAYMTLKGKTLSELAVDESKVDPSKVVTKDDLANLS